MNNNWQEVFDYKIEFNNQFDDTVITNSSIPSMIKQEATPIIHATSDVMQELINKNPGIKRIVTRCDITDESGDVSKIKLELVNTTQP